MGDLKRTYLLVSKERIEEASHGMAAASSRAAMIEIYRREDEEDFVFGYVHNKG